jgi:hypothetical protein
VQESGVSLVTQQLQCSAAVVREDVGSTESLKRSAGRAVATPDVRGAVLSGVGGFLLHAKDGLEEVVVEPHSVIEAVEGSGLGDRVEALMAEVASDEGGVLLLDEAVVVLVERATAGEAEARDSVVPVADEMIIEELTAIVRMDLQDREG